MVKALTLSINTDIYNILHDFACAHDEEGKRRNMIGKKYRMPKIGSSLTCLAIMIGATQVFKYFRKYQKHGIHCCVHKEARLFL